MNGPSPYAFAQAMSALRSVHAHLLHDDPDMEQDQRLLNDMLDGEVGDAMAVLDDMIRAIALAEGLADEARLRAKLIGQRADRFDNRATRFRAGVFAAMDALGLRKRETASATVSIAQGQPKVEITDADALPQGFVRTTVTRTPDKIAIKRALEAGEDVPGAVLNNTIPQLRIRSA